jgi:preprotein translocase subunit SecG
METVIIVIHLMLVVALVVAVLLQKSEGGALGIGSGGGFMSSRGTANVLTRTTAILGTGFFLTSLVLAVLASRHSDKPASIVDSVAPASAPASAPAAPASAGSNPLDQLREMQQKSGQPAPLAPTAPAK